jgi:hypothetical protein
MLRYSLLIKCTLAKGPAAMHVKQQADDNKVVNIFSRQKNASNQVRSSGRSIDGTLRAIEKSTSVKGRLTTTGEEDVELILAYSTEGCRHTHERCWEGYDPGMDVGF